MSNKGQFVCATCGSTNVISDAPCKWDIEQQEWVKCGEVYDDTYCNECEEEVRVNFREIQP